MSDAYEVLPVETRLLSRLVGRIYDCAIDPDHWEGVLLEIREALDFCNAMFTVWTAPRGDTLLNVTSGIPEPFAETLAGFGDQIVEAWGGAANIAGYALGEPKVLSWERDPSDWIGSSYYREWLAPQHITDLMAVAVTRDASLYCSLGFARHGHSGAITTQEVDFVRLLVPHVQRAVAISRMLDIQSVSAATFAAVIGALPAPVVLVDRDLNIVHANPAAEPVVARGAGLSVDGARISGASLETPLHRAITGQQSAAAIPVHLRDLGPAVLHILPLEHGPVRRTLAPGAVAAIFVSTETARAAPTAAIATLFDLTPAETRLLAAIATGSTLNEAAQQLGVGTGTARTHLLRLFAKTGTNRQADLLRLTDALSFPL